MFKREKKLFVWLHVCHMIICLIFAENRIGIMKGNETCVVDNLRLNCLREIPTVIYGEIAEVYISQFVQKKIDISAFDDISWTQVKILTIEVRKDINLDRIENGTFQSLESLTDLTFRCWKLTTLEAGAFYSLGYLKLLNLSGNTYLQVDTLTKALHEIQSIDTFILDEVGSVFSRVVNLGQEFIDILHQKEVKHMSLSNTNIYLETVSFMQEALPIKELNLSHSQIYLQHVNQDIVFYHLLSDLRVLDISGIDKRFFEAPITSFQFNCNIYNNVFIILMFGLVRLYSNDVNMLEFVLSGSVLNASLCQCKLKVFQCRSFNLTVLNVTIYWPNDSPLIDVDISRNAMEYFSIKGYIPISKLDLSYNQLYRMQNSLDFSQ